MALSKGVPERRKVTDPTADYWVKYQEEMRQKREAVLQKLREAPKLRALLIFFYDHKVPLSFRLLTTDPGLRSIHRLSSEQLAGRIADLRELGVLVPAKDNFGDEDGRWTLSFFGKSLLDAHIKEIRAGNF